MTTEEKKKKIMTFLRCFSGHYGSVKINNALGIKNDSHGGSTHAILKKLMAEGKLEQSQDKKGFRITAESYYEKKF